jgi:hypothetical protein
MLTQTLKKRGFNVTVENGRLAVSPKSKLTDDLRDFIRTNKDQLVSELQTGKMKMLLILKTKLART